MKTTDNTASGTVKQGRRPMFKPFEEQIEELQQELVNEATKHARTMQERDTALAALRDIETRAGYCVARPDKTNNDIQIEYIRQQASNAISTMESK